MAGKKRRFADNDKSPVSWWGFTNVCIGKHNKHKDTKSYLLHYSKLNKIEDC